MGALYNYNDSNALQPNLVRRREGKGGRWIQSDTPCSLDYHDQVNPSYALLEEIKVTDKIYAVMVGGKDVVWASDLQDAQKLATDRKKLEPGRQVIILRTVGTVELETRLVLADENPSGNPS